jgi:hypothetical protein
MNRLQEIKQSFDKGRMDINDIQYLIQKVESQESEIKDYQESLIRARNEIKQLRAGVCK